MADIKTYFSIKELVSKATYNAFRERAWAFFDPRLLETIVFIREHLGIPLVVNNWSSNGTLQQRGLRCNTDQIVADKTKAGKMYCSAHTRGQAVDFSSGKMSAKDIRKWIRAHEDELPYPIRLESDASAPTWVHLDVCNTSVRKIVEFSV